jgi:hypothetical protein
MFFCPRVPFIPFALCPRIPFKLCVLTVLIVVRITPRINQQNIGRAF